jgi:hypothetical protein
MDDETTIRAHIASVTARDDAGSATLIQRFQRACWPGGGDRTEPSALLWLQRWRPARAAGSVPVCSCAAGHCTVCN